MIGNGESLFKELGIPEALIPAPFPLLPVPKGLIRDVEGLRTYKAYVLRDPNEIEYIGMVWGENREEAMEAAENLKDVELGKTIFGVIKAVGVVRAPEED